MNNVSDLMFRTWSQPGMADGKTVPPTLRVDYSKDGGQSWITIQLSTQLNGQDYTFPDSDTKITGACDAATNICSYHITGTVTIVAKPWGSAEAPDCTGFTAGQLSAMDFGKMDLSEWLSLVMEKAKENAGTTTSSAVTSADLAAFNSSYKSGKVESITGGANFARVTPPQGFGPFEVQLMVSGYWPGTTGDPAQDTDVVTHVDADWGDCTSVDAMSSMNSAVVGAGYVARHTFVAPDKLNCGSANANVQQVIKITAYTSKSGIQQRTVSVENAWSKFPGSTGKNNDIVPVTTTVSTDK
jgi:hypothetical protein